LEVARPDVVTLAQSAVPAKAPQRLLAIDSGMNVGWALFERGRYLRGSTWDGYHLVELLDVWFELHPDEVVIEPCVPRGNGALELRLQTVMGVLRGAFPGAIYIPASVWKPISGNWPMPLNFPKGLTVHQRDACRMAMYYLWREHVPALRQGRCICEGEFIWACGPECDCFHHAPWEEV
jgi:hypothetical protein